MTAFTRHVVLPAFGLHHVTPRERRVHYCTAAAPVAAFGVPPAATGTAATELRTGMARRQPSAAKEKCGFYGKRGEEVRHGSETFQMVLAAFYWAVACWRTNGSRTAAIFCCWLRGSREAASNTRKYGHVSIFCK